MFNFDIVESLLIVRLQNRKVMGLGDILIKLIILLDFHLAEFYDNSYRMHEARHIDH